MDMLNRKGFTLIELIATVMLLAVIMGIGSYSILNILNANKESNYKHLIEEIKSAVEVHYQECSFSKSRLIVDDSCATEFNLGFLVEGGYLKGNDGDDSSKLINPKDNVDISECIIQYVYNSITGNIEINAVTSTGSCPVTCDYNPDDESCSAE